MRDVASPGSERFWSPELDTLPRAETRELQSQKVAAAYKYLWHCSDYYRRKFERAGLDVNSVQDLSDLPKVPLTHPAEWIDDQAQTPPWGTFSPVGEDEWADRGWMLFSTSGTTASKPRLFRHTVFDRDQLAWQGARALYAMGVRRGDIAFNCFAYGTSVAFWGLHYALNHMGIPVVSGGGASTERRAQLIRTAHPTVVLGTPSYLLHLGRELARNGGPPLSVRRLVAAGEVGASLPGTRARLEALWGARVHDDFGCTEVAMSPLGYSCEADQESEGRSPHLLEDQYYVEAISPDSWSPVADGHPGVLVVSNLFSEATPILRYVMGDFVTLSEEPCACGRSHRRALGGLRGRHDDVVKVKGLKFYPATFEDAVRSLAGAHDEYRVEVDRLGDLDIVRITLEVGPHGPSKPDVARSLRVQLGIEVELNLVPVGTLPRPEAKVKRFFDHRPLETLST